MGTWGQPIDQIVLESHVGQGLFCIMLAIIVLVWLGRPRGRR